MNSIDIDRPSTWSKYRAGLCDGCWGGCCTLPVEVSASDLMRLGLITEDEAAASQKKVARRLISEGKIQHFTPRTGIYILAQTHGRDCVFLNGKTRLCTVYDKRPEVCRIFPKIGPRPGFCPSRRKKG